MQQHQLQHPAALTQPCDDVEGGFADRGCQRWLELTAARPWVCPHSATLAAAFALAGVEASRVSGRHGCSPAWMLRRRLLMVAV